MKLLSLYDQSTIDIEANFLCDNTIESDLWL